MTYSINWPITVRCAVPSGNYISPDGLPVKHCGILRLPVLNPDNKTMYTSNCHLAADKNCLARSAWHPATSTNWLIITCSRKLSMFIKYISFKTLIISYRTIQHTQHNTRRLFTNNLLRCAAAAAAPTRLRTRVIGQKYLHYFDISFKQIQK